MSQPESPALRVGRQLAERRDSLEMTQSAVAAAVDITPTTVSAIENGRNQIRRSNRAGWERVLRLKPGTIGRAYKTGQPLEVAEGDDERESAIYADLSDEHEAAIWRMRGITEDDRRKLIDILRLARNDERRRKGA